jgi:hypothetical protein
MSDARDRQRAGRDDRDEREPLEDVLEAFNAEGVIEHPGDPEAGDEGESPASDADAPVPPG